MSKRPAPIESMTEEQKQKQEFYIRSFLAHMHVVEQRREAVIKEIDTVKKLRNAGKGARATEMRNLQWRLSYIQDSISKLGTVYKGLVTGRIAPWKK